MMHALLHVLTERDGGGEKPQVAEVLRSLLDPEGMEGREQARLHPLTLTLTLALTLPPTLTLALPLPLTPTSRREQDDLLNLFYDEFVHKLARPIAGRTEAGTAPIIPMNTAMWRPSLRWRRTWAEAGIACTLQGPTPQRNVHRLLGLGAPKTQKTPTPAHSAQRAQERQYRVCVVFRRAPPPGSRRCP